MLLLAKTLTKIGQHLYYMSTSGFCLMMQFFCRKHIVESLAKYKGRCNVEGDSAHKAAQCAAYPTLDWEPM